VGYLTISIPENEPLTRVWLEEFRREVIEAEKKRTLDIGLFPLLLCLYERGIATKWSCSGHPDNDWRDPITGEIRWKDSGYLALQVNDEGAAHLENITTILMDEDLIFEAKTRSPYSWYLYFQPGKIHQLVNTLLDYLPHRSLLEENE